MLKRLLPYLVLFIIAYSLATSLNQYDLDLWARLAVGSVFLQTGQVLKHDIFAYTPTKTIWIDHEWGSGVIFFFLSHHFGEFSLIIFKSLLIFLIFVLIFRIAQLQSNKIINIDILYFIFVAFSIFFITATQIRSQMFTFAFFILWIYILERIRRGENRLLWTLPATMCIWANLHGGFVLGFLLLLTYALGEFLNKKSPLKYLLISLITLLTVLVNPYGIKYLKYMLEAVGIPRPYVPEWQPLSLEYPYYKFLGISLHISTGFFIFSALTAFVSFKLWIKKISVDWVKLILFMISFCLSLKYHRLTMIFILAVSSLFYNHFIDLFSSLIKLKGIIKFKKFAVCTIIVVYIIVYLPWGRIKLKALPSQYPVGSVEFIKQNKISGNVAVPFNWGSYALWKLYPQCLISFDGRYDGVYPDDVYDKMFNFSLHLNDKWNEFLKIYHTDVIIAPKIYTPNELKSLSGWQMIYEDDISVVLLPKNKLKKIYHFPDWRKSIYWHEDISKNISLD